MSHLLTIASCRCFKTPIPLLLTATTISLSLFTSGIAHGQTYSGTNTDGKWSTSSNWTTPPPLNGGSNVTISFGGSSGNLSTINDLTSTGTNGVYTLNSLVFNSTAGAYSVSGASLDFVSNSSTTPSLILNGAAPITIASNISLGNNLAVTGSGSATLSGLLTGAGTLTSATTGQLNMAGTGSLTLTGGANINLLQITGVGSTTTLSDGTYILNATNNTSPKAPLSVDSTGAAAVLNIQNGANVSSAQHVYIGRLANSRGTATVSGSTTQLTAAGQLTIGSNSGSVGILTIQNGALAQAASSFVGAGAGSSGTVTVTGSNSRYNTTANLVVGSIGAGTLQLQNGGTSLVAGLLSIGDNAGSNGSVTVDGVGSSITTTGNIMVGNNSTGAGSVAAGALTVQNGGAVTSGNTVFIAARASSTGNLTVTGAGSSLSVTGQLQIGGQGGTSGGTGQLNVLSGGSLTTTDDLIIYGPGTATFNNSSATVGNISTGGTSNGSIVVNNSTLIFGGTNTDRQFGGTITGTNATFTKIGTGTTTLSGISTYTGTTVINNGTLSVDGTLASTGSVVVNAGGRLDGTGSVGSILLNSGGALGSRSGDSLDATSLLWNGGSTLNFQLGNAADTLNLTGALTKGTGSVFQFSFGNNGVKNGDFFSLITFGSQAGFTTNDFSYTANGFTGNFVLESNQLRFAVVVVPELPSVGFMVCGAALLPFALRWSKRRAARVTR